MAKVINLSFDQGSNVQFNISVLDANGFSLDLSGYTPTATFRKHYGSANSYSFTCAGYANGTLIMTMNADTSANVAGGRYVYDTFIEHVGTGTFSKIQEGILTVRPSQTR